MVLVNPLEGECDTLAGLPLRFEHGAAVKPIVRAVRNE
jgi:hypothetical protein